jgi:hypothetical protein
VLAARAALGAGIVAGLSLAWFHREVVLDAYALEPEPKVDIKLSGLDLTVEPSPVPRSPFVVEGPADTRDRTVTVTSDPEEDEPPPVVASIDGTAELSGLVVGPEGPVPFATVRLERHTTAGMSTHDVSADETGRWSSPDLLGGRYRVRSWLAGEYRTGQSHVLFVDDDEPLELDLEVEPVDEGAKLTFSDGGAIYVGLSGTVAVTVTQQSVDADGYVVVAGVPGAVVTLAASAGVTVSPPVAVADGAGVARFVVSCQRPGPMTGITSYGEEAVWVALPECLPPPPVTAPPNPDPAPVDPAGAAAPR